MKKVEMKKKIPITVLTGFLGSGKTTLLNYILTHNEGLKIGVIVNDFGSINIDSKLVTKQTDSKLELSNGCICCSLGSLDLQEAIAQFVYPSSPIDYIVIEASGLAEPYDLLVTLRDSMNFDVKLDSIIGLIDAENIEQNAKENPTALKQAEFSDFIVINKIDLVSKEKLADIKQLILAVNPRARIFEVTHGEVDLHLILDQDVFEDKNLSSEHSHDDHAHEHFEHFSFSTSEPLEPMKFQEFVNTKLPSNIYRAKGLVDLGKKGGERKFIFQLVGSRASIEWDNWGSDVSKTELVFIGKNVDQEKILDGLRACVDPNPNEKVPEGYEVKLPKRAN